MFSGFAERTNRDTDLDNLGPGAARINPVKDGALHGVRRTPNFPAPLPGRSTVKDARGR